MLSFVLDKALLSDEGGGSAETEDTEADTTYDETVRAKKKRKVTRELREYTGVPSDGERKYKGWSDEGMAAFKGWVKDIQEDVAEKNTKLGR
jgi:hypothetical protein